RRTGAVPGLRWTRSPLCPALGSSEYSAGPLWSDPTSTGTDVAPHRRDGGIRDQTDPWNHGQRGGIGVGSLVVDDPAAVARLLIRSAAPGTRHRYIRQHADAKRHRRDHLSAS